MLSCRVYALRNAKNLDWLGSKLYLALNQKCHQCICLQKTLLRVGHICDNRVEVTSR